MPVHGWHQRPATNLFCERQWHRPNLRRATIHSKSRTGKITISSLFKKNSCGLSLWYQSLLLLSLLLLFFAVVVVVVSFCMIHQNMHWKYLIGTKNKKEDVRPKYVMYFGGWRTDEGQKRILLFGKQITQCAVRKIDLLLVVLCPGHDLQTFGRRPMLKTALQVIFVLFEVVWMLDFKSN